MERSKSGALIQRTINRMANYLLHIQYDGTRYKGWQIQKTTDNTIQGKLKAVIERLFDEEVDIIGSGRTDAGVHALDQIANFHLNSEIEDLEEFLRDINRYLPEDIAVNSIEKVADRFHSRYSAKSKTYRYRIYTGIYSNVFERKFVYHYKDKKLCVEDMIKGAQLLIGEHDFISFCGNKHMKKSSIREIYGISIEESKDEIIIEYSGNGFLQNMVRIMTGTLIEIGNGSKKPDDIITILRSKDRATAGYTAPPQGLCLVEVNY